MGADVKDAAFKLTAAGWVADPSGEPFDVYHEAAGLVWVQCRRDPSIGFAVPATVLAAPTKPKKEA